MKKVRPTTATRADLEDQKHTKNTKNKNNNKKQKFKNPKINKSKTCVFFWSSRSALVAVVGRNLFCCAGKWGRELVTWAGIQGLPSFLQKTWALSDLGVCSRTSQVVVPEKCCPMMGSRSWQTFVEDPSRSF